MEVVIVSFTSPAALNAFGSEKAGGQKTTEKTANTRSRETAKSDASFLK